MATVHEQIMKYMDEFKQQFAKAGIDVEMPPEMIKIMPTEYTAFEPGRSLTAIIHYDAKFGNPLRTFQGGFIAAAFDNVYGPLTYMAAQKPVLTVEMSTSFIRPFTAKDELVEIKCEVVSQSKTLMVLKGEMKTKAGKLVAVSTNHSIILADQSIKSN